MGNGSTGAGRTHTARKPKPLPAGQLQPTRHGKPFYSGHKSRIHLRTKQATDAPIACQRNSKSAIWKRDMVSVPPGKESKVSCGRCRLVINTASAGA